MPTHVWTEPTNYAPLSPLPSADVNTEIFDNLRYLHENLPLNGWNDSTGETWAYSSADAPTFVFSIAGVDLTGKYQPGHRIRLKQGGAYKYFIVTAVAFTGGNTQVTVYGGTDYTLTSATITDNYYSYAKAPIGFPLEPAKWTVELRDTSDRSQATATNNTWYNLGSLSISIPIGSWRVFYEVALLLTGGGTATARALVSLSTANNSASDVDLVGMRRAGATGSAEAGGTVHKEKPLTLAAKTTYYLNGLSNTGNNSGTVAFQGSSDHPTVVRAVCAYL